MLEFFKGPMVIRDLRKQMAEMQNTLTVLIGDAAVSSTSRGNPYSNYKTAVQEIAKKYEGVANWGNQQIRNIIDVRSAFIIGQGIKLITEKETDKTSREFEFIQEFIKHNNLDEEMPQELAKEAEIEGRILVKLVPNMEKKQIDLRFISYSVNGYKVETSEDDYLKYERVTYQTSTKKVELKPEEFVYKRFAGRTDKVNDVMPKVGMVLRNIEDLDKALVDWRAINNLFAAPTPYFKVTDKDQVDSYYKYLSSINWKIGKLLVGTADFELVCYQGNPVLENEITMHCKVISGATGVPVHFLGLPDLMSNRAVSTDLFEFINASTNKERKIWEGFYEELYVKVLAMANANFKTGFTEGKVKASVLSITEAKIQELATVWLPLYTAGVIDLNYFLGKIPDIEPEDVRKAQAEQAKKMLDEIKRYEALNNKGGAGGAQPQDQSM